MKLLSSLTILMFAVSASFAQEFEWHQVQRPANSVDVAHGGLYFEVTSTNEVLCDNYMWKTSDHGATWSYQEENKVALNTYKSNGKAYNIDTLGFLFYDRSSKSWKRSYTDSVNFYDKGTRALNFAGFVGEGNGDLFLAITKPNKLLRSTNGGISWDSVGSVPAGQGYGSLLSVDHLGRIYFLGTGALFLSSDKGAHWEAVYQYSSRGTITSVAHLHSGETYAVTKDQNYWLLKSDPSAKNWRTQTGLSGGLSIVASLKGTLFGSNADAKLLRSLDSGVTWQDISEQPGSLVLVGKPIVDSSNIIYAAGYGKNRGSLFTGRGIYISRDEGVTWYKSGIPRYAIFDINPVPSRKQVLLNTYVPYLYTYSYNYGLGVGGTGYEWGVTLSDSLRESDRFFDNIDGSYDTSLYKTAYDTERDRIVCFAQLQYKSGNKYRDEVLISTDAGQSWEYRNFPPLSNGTYITDQFISKNGTIYIGTAGYSGGGSYAYRSTDNGISWDQLLNGITNPNIYAIGESPTGFIFVGSQSSIFRTKETYFTKLKPNIVNTNVTCFAFDSAKGIYAGTDDQGVIYSNDNGETWKPLRNGLPLDTIVSVLMVTPNGSVLAATHNGLYALAVGDTTWHEESTGLKDRQLTSLAMLDDETYLVGTYQSGLYVNKPFPSPMPVLGVKLPPSVRVEGASLLATNYPNPFMKETTIRYEVTEPGRVTLEVYSLLGERVAVLEDGYYGPGTYESPYVARDIPPGTYLYRLRIGDYTEVKRMIKQ